MFFNNKFIGIREVKRDLDPGESRGGGCSPDRRTRVRWWRGGFRRRRWDVRGIEAVADVKAGDGAVGSIWACPKFIGMRGDFMASTIRNRRGAKSNCFMVNLLTDYSETETPLEGDPRASDFQKPGA